MSTAAHTFPPSSDSDRGRRSGLPREDSPPANAVRHGRRVAPVADQRRLTGADYVGTAVHATITAAIAELPSPVRYSGVARLADAHVPVGLDAPYRQSMRSEVTSAAMRYFASFRLPPEWTPLGVELNVSDVRMDMVFIHRQGAVIADELKTSALSHDSDRARAIEQARGQLVAALGVFGDRFAGVRLVCLLDPRRSAYVAVDRVYPWRPGLALPIANGWRKAFVLKPVSSHNRRKD